jgi:TM2 domain-containing membrane protein YozV
LGCSFSTFTPYKKLKESVMKNIIRKTLFWVIPILTTVCSIIYIGLAVNENENISFEKNRSVRDITLLLESNFNQ